MNDLNNQDVIISTQTGNSNTVGIITLNRASALNALNHNMIITITNALLEWQNNKEITAVFIRGNSERAFCAGGDIKSLYTNGKESPEQCMQFFHDEYKLNSLIYHYPKPYISLLHGITMGGGLGVSIHGSHKIAAKNLVLAMPETGIGFFPDIGASYFLSRCENQAGLYLGLTGHKINAFDAKHLNLINYIIKDDDYINVFDNIINNVVNYKFYNINFDLNNIISNYCNSKDQDNTQDSYAIKNNITPNLRNISACFNANSIADICYKLAKYTHDQPWSISILSALKQKSPSSLLITYEMLKRGAALDFKQCMQMEYGLAYGFLKHSDLYEGIRAVLIDKDGQPKWENTDITDDKNFNYSSYFITSMSKKLDL